MESHVQSVEDHLVEGLQFQLGATAKYVTNRRSVTFWPAGGNSYSSNGVKVIKSKFNSRPMARPAKC